MIILCSKNTSSISGMKIEENLTINCSFFTNKIVTGVEAPLEEINHTTLSHAY